MNLNSDEKKHKKIMTKRPEQDGHSSSIRPSLYRLDELMDQSRCVPDKYEELILEERREYDSRVDTTFADAWKFLYDKEEWKEAASFPEMKTGLETFRRLFWQHLQGSNLIDLGGGGWYGKNYMRDLAKHFQARLYINAERRSQLDWQAYNVHSEPEQDGDFVAVDLDADMLAFVSQMKDDSANFTLNGIDYGVIGGYRYHRALAKELMRVTRPGGLIFGVCSNVLSILEEEHFPLKKIERLGYYSRSDMYIWEKPE